MRYRREEGSIVVVRDSFRLVFEGYEGAAFMCCCDCLGVEVSVGGWRDRCWLLGAG